MTDDLDALQAETEAALAAAADLRAWDAVRVATLGRNGRLTALLRDLGKTPAEQRRERGAALNRLKDALTLLIEARRAELEHAELDARLAAERLDPTLPPAPARWVSSIRSAAPWRRLLRSSAPWAARSPKAPTSNPTG